TRSASTPDIGADEFNGIVIDLFGPRFSYTALGDTTDTTDRVISVTISDATAVDQTAGGGPRMWFRKGNSGPFVQTSCVSTGGTPHIGTYYCTINYSLVSGGSVTSGDTVQYYVAAQDTASTPNVSVN